jgi:hypothetical protein
MMKIYEVKGARPVQSTSMRKGDGLVTEMEKLLIVWRCDQAQ